MRCVLLTIGFVLLSAAPSDASCIASIKYQGEWYSGGRASLKLGARLPDRAVMPACNDAGQDDPDRKVAVHRIAGVDPSVALATRGMAWWNAYTFPWLADHPLHKRLGLDRQRGPRHKGKPCTITATVKETLGELSIDHKPQRFVTLRPTTKVTLRRHGVAWIEPGMKIRIRGGCGRDTIYADSIDRA